MTEEKLPQPMYDVLNPKTGVLKEYPLCMKPISARSKRLDSNGGEILCADLIVNPLNRQPSIKSMVDHAERSGQLHALQLQAQNLQLAEDGDPDFEGYDRNWLEENFLTEAEVNFYEHEYPLPDVPDAPNPPPATPVAAPPSTQTEGPPAPDGGPSPS